MLQSLSIKDFILIKQLDLDLNRGFSVITGETGAGKSILLDSILFCFGRKFSRDIIRNGADSCSVTLVFSLSEVVKTYLDDACISAEDELIIKRLQYLDGKKRFFINDQIVTQTIIQNLFNLCLELHGQHTHTSLINPAMHMEIVDEYGNLAELKSTVQDSYNLWQKIEKEISSINKEKDFIEREIDYLSHICNEIEQTQIQEGEEEKLASIKQKLQLQDKETMLVNSVISDIESSAIDQIIARSQRNLSKATNTKDFEKVNVLLEEAYDKIEDAKSLLFDNLRDQDCAEYSLSDVEDRLYEIRTVARKHNCASSELSEFLKISQEKLASLQTSISKSKSLVIESDQARSSYFKAAIALSNQRIKYSRELEVKTMKELAELQMQKATFRIEITSNEALASFDGIDKIQFVASTNPGMQEAPIDKIASGGELSRFMLALRAALLDKNYKQTLIFDEIDVGISGAVSESIGIRLRNLSQVTQVIAITHQPQVAGKADQHILVRKTQHHDQTTIDVITLNHQEKSQELARMISGKEITKAGLIAAKELIG